MKQKIIDSLINCKQSFDKSFEDFAYKMDMSAVFENECQNYLNPICEKIVPILVKELKEDKSQKIEDYFPFISPKYHQAIKKEVDTFEIIDESINKKLSKNIVDNFLKELMNNTKGSEKERLNFLITHLKSISHLLKGLLEKDPGLCLITCAQMRNPKMQNMIINNLSRDFTDKLTKFLESQNVDFFNRTTLKLFCYPQEVTVEDYYKKWIGKDNLHVKFCKNILSTHYESSKQYLKKLEKDKLKTQVKNKEKIFHR